MLYPVGAMIRKILQLMRSKLNNVTSEGKAEYEKALAKAFETLLNVSLTGSSRLRFILTCECVTTTSTDRRILITFNANQPLQSAHIQPTPPLFGAESYQPVVRNALIIVIATVLSFECGAAACDACD